MYRRTALKLLGAAGVSGVAGATAEAGTGAPSRRRPGYAPLGSVDLPAAAEAVVDDAAETAYVATFDGFAVVDVSDPANPETLQHRGVMADYASGPLQGIADLSLDGDRLLVGGPYNGGAALQGFALYDVSDPSNVERVLAHETDAIHHNLKYRDGTAYFTRDGSAGNELVVADVAGGEYRERGTWGLVDYDEAWADVGDATTYVHDLRPHGDRVYLARWDAGTFVVDVSDPDEPTGVAKIGGFPASELAAWSRERARNQSLEPPGNHHFVTVDDEGTLLGVGKEAWDVAGTDGGGPAGVELWDVSDVENAEKLATIDPPPSPNPTFENPDTTAHNFEIHGDRLFTSWYHGGVKIHDVSDPANPERLAWWRDPGEASFWTARRANAEFLVASSTSVGNMTTRSALYTFPNGAGEQADPPGTFVTATPEPDGSPDADRSPGGTAGRTGTARPGDGTAAPGDRTPSTETTVPGPGVAGAVGAVALAAWRRARRGAPGDD